jgi:hypothetical protein
MNDTPEAIAEVMRTKFRQKNNEERLRMGFSMFDSAKAIMLASKENLSITEKRKMIFLKLYENELDRSTIKKVLAHLESLSV